MNEAFIVKPLKCDHCGNELPVMGQFVSFQCQTCFNYWILTPQGLKPITVYRVTSPADGENELLFLPFWVVEVNAAELRRQMEGVIEELRSATRVIASTDIEMEEPEFDGIVKQDPELDLEMRKARFLSEATRSKRAPTSGEVNYLLNRIENSGCFYVYIPAFLSPNTYAYLKVGRLLTRCQPAYKMERSLGLGRSVLCALQADEAISLMDFVFFATLPESILSNGDFLKNIHLEPTGPPYLVEFPFEQRGATLVSLIGEFHISSKLVDLSQQCL